MRLWPLLFCCAAAAADLPRGSEMLAVNNTVYHVHKKIPDTAPLDRPTIVLLSGPSGRWHSDSAWFALLQPLLAKHYNTVAIDRAGHGFGQAPTQSYREFGQALPTILQKLDAKTVVIVGFASANLALAHYVNSDDAKTRLKGVLLIDPDALGPDIAEFYAVQAKDFQNPGLADYVRSGKYDQRAENARVSEREEAANLIPAHLQTVMDWAFYDAVSGARKERERIIERFAEVSRYDEDVRSAAKLAWPKTVATVLWDTDFEAEDIARNPDNKELVAWRENSQAWFAAQFGACHKASASRQHLATFAEAEQLVAEVNALASGKACRP